MEVHPAALCPSSSLPSLHHSPSHSPDMPHLHPSYSLSRDCNHPPGSDPDSPRAPPNASPSSSRSQSRYPMGTSSDYPVSAGWPLHANSLPTPHPHASRPIPASSRHSLRPTSPDTPRRASTDPYLYHSVQLPSTQPTASPTRAPASHQPYSATAVPRLPPILQVEKQQVTTSATQAASASRRRNEAHFVCPVPGCGSTFTRRFNLRGHLRSHTAERPFLCEWPGCNKGFARQHDCRRHQALHASRSQGHLCQGCGKNFSRLDALNRHWRSDGGAECRQTSEAAASAARLSPEDEWENRSNSTERSGRRTP
ncbi:hypothetical protein SCP_0308580 [Sparassis crispa]|uniref:C2H2-type domain-containing protein n=1 Tax=Sparassis crispa TaxID=139825 RepID=A0A401GG41_9APHY|nr:hypothetical protein SCP_0308580 [Sparassis crispa]GBE81132.1 hypothetical protein SCP_0308580 [Sparassis crispa]